MSLRYQINLRIVMTSIMIIILGGVFSILQVRSAVSREITSSLNLAAQLIQLNFAEAKPGTVDINVWLPRFVSLEQTRHLKIQHQQANGEIVKFSAQPKAQSDIDDPPKWFIRLVATDYPELKQQFNAGNGKFITLIIQANPLDEIGEAWKESRIFLVSLLLMTSLTILAVNLVFNKALKAIGCIIEALQALEQDNYQQQLPSFSTLEFNAIANAINHLTLILNTTHQKNRALTLHSQEIQEEERRYLAKELHDEFGQSLTAIKVMAVTIKNKKTAVEPITETIIGICDHLVGVVRSMMRNLHPMTLSELGLKACLEDQLNHWTNRYPELKVVLECPEAVDQIDSKVTIQIFRIIQECLTNIVRHADADEALIVLNLNDEQSQLRLIVEDNGRGCTEEQLKSGFGIQGMRERVKSLDGAMTLQTSPEDGMKISVWIPLARTHKFEKLQFVD